MSMLADPMTASSSSKITTLAWSISGAIEKHLPARVMQVAQIAGACQVGRQVIRPEGHDQPDVHPPSGRKAERPGQHLVGHEVRRDDPDPLSRPKIWPRSDS